MDESRRDCPRHGSVFGFPRRRICSGFRLRAVEVELNELMGPKTVLHVRLLLHRATTLNHVGISMRTSIRTPLTA